MRNFIERNHIEKLSPEDRKTWRQWQAGAICFYAVVAVVLIGIGAFLPAKTELARSTPEVSTQIAQK